MPQVDLFTMVHKGLRWRMGGVCARLGAASFADAGSEEALAELEQFLGFLDEHTLHEETFIAPLLLARGGDRTAGWQLEHHRLEEVEAALRRDVQAIRELGRGHPSAEALGLSLYRTVNRFAAELLRHLDFEETVLMPLLWSVCTDQELAEVMTAFKARYGVEAAKFYAQVGDAYSPRERSLLGL